MKRHYGFVRGLQKKNMFDDVKPNKGIEGCFGLGSPKGHIVRHVGKQGVQEMNVAEAGGRAFSGVKRGRNGSRGL